MKSCVSCHTQPDRFKLLKNIMRDTGISVTRSFRQYVTVFLAQNLQYSLTKPGSILSGYMNAQNRHCSSIGLRPPFWSTPSWPKHGCHYCYTNSRTNNSFNRPLILSGMSPTFFGPFLRALQKKVYMVTSQTIGLHHTLLIILLY
jgi:hypothetical protein